MCKQLAFLVCGKVLLTQSLSTLLYSRNSLSRHSGYVDVFVKSQILSLYIAYTILRQYFAYLDMSFRSKTAFI